MGHLSNPVGLRLGKNRAWLIKGTDSYYQQKQYLYFFLYKTVKKYFGRRKFRYLGFIFSHITFRYISLSISLVDARFETLYFKILSITKKLLKELRYYKRVRFNKRYSLDRFIKRRKLIPLVVRDILLKVREPFFFLISSIIKQILLKGLSVKFYKKHTFDIYINTLSNYSLTSQAIGFYVLRKLKANNRLPSIFKPIIRGFKRFFKGMRVYCAGRFTRNQRASFSVFWFGKVSLNNFAQPIDYSFLSIPLKYGVGSIKIWIARKDLL